MRGEAALEAVIEVIGWVDAVVFGALAVLALVRWRRSGGAAVGWLAATFTVLAVVVVAGAVTPEGWDGTDTEPVRRLLVMVLLLFPYFLFRFMSAIEPARRAFELMAAGLTLACLIATLWLPTLPQQGAPRPDYYGLYAGLVLVQWTSLSSVVAVRLWRTGRGLAGVARGRMRLLSLASVALNLALVLAAVRSSTAPTSLSLLVELSVAASALLFFLGFEPPPFLRALWRREEQEELRRATVKLIVATSRTEATASILPHLASIVGGRAAALIDHDGGVMDSHDASDDLLRSLPELLEAEARSSAFAQDLTVLDAPFGKLVIWGAAATPVFGRDEIEVLQTLAALTGLALERTELFERERAARRALERANRELESTTAELEQEVAERRRAEEDLVESQMQLAEAQQLTMLGSWSWDAEADRIQWSDHLFEIFGITPGDFDATLEGFMAMIHPDDQAKMRTLIERINESEDSFAIDHRIVRSDGRTRVVHARGKVIRAAAGHPVRIIGTAQDVTSNRQREAALRASELRFRSVAESAIEGIVSIDERGRIVFWNRGAQEIFGYWDDEVKDRPVQMLMPERFRADHERGLRRYLETGQSSIIGRTIELAGLRKDGREFPLELSVSTWTVDGQRFFTAMLRDISDRRHAEDELRRLTKERELILNAAGEGIYGLNVNGITRFVNPAAAALLGYEVEELIGRPEHPTIHHSRAARSSYPPEECRILRAIREGTTARVADEIFWHKDGGPVPIEYVVSPITENDVVTGGVVVFWARSAGGDIGRMQEDHPEHGARPVG